MLGLAGIPSIIQFIGFLWLPESPRWLVEKDRVEDARKVLIHIRKTTDIDRELDGIKNAIADHRKEQEEGKCLKLFVKLDTIFALLITDLFSENPAYCIVLYQYIHPYSAYSHQPQGREIFIYLYNISRG